MTLPFPSPKPMIICSNWCRDKHSASFGRARTGRADLPEIAKKRGAPPTTTSSPSAAQASVSWRSSWPWSAVGFRETMPCDGLARCCHAWSAHRDTTACSPISSMGGLEQPFPSLGKTMGAMSSRPRFCSRAFFVPVSTSKGAPRSNETFVGALTDCGRRRNGTGTGAMGEITFTGTGALPISGRWTVGLPAGMKDSWPMFSPPARQRMR